MCHSVVVSVTVIIIMIIVNLEGGCRCVLVFGGMGSLFLRNVERDATQWT